MGFLGIKYVIVSLAGDVDENRFVEEMDSNKEVKFVYHNDNKYIYEVKEFKKREDIFIPKSIIYIPGNLFSLYSLLDFDDFGDEDVFLFNDNYVNEKGLLRGSTDVMIPIGIKEINNTYQFDKYRYEVVSFDYEINKNNDMSVVDLDFLIKNWSSDVWENDGDEPIKLGYKIFRLDEKEELVYEGREYLTKYIIPGELVRFNFPIELKGNFKFKINMILLKENRFWFEGEDSGLDLYIDCINMGSKFENNLLEGKNKEIMIAYDFYVPDDGLYQILVKDLPIIPQTWFKIDDEDWRVMPAKRSIIGLCDVGKVVLSGLNMKKGMHKIFFDNLNFALNDFGSRVNDSFIIYKNKSKIDFDSSYIDYNKNRNFNEISMRSNEIIPIFVNDPVIYPWKIK